MLQSHLFTCKPEMNEEEAEINFAVQKIIHNRSIVTLPTDFQFHNGSLYCLDKGKEERSSVFKIDANRLGESNSKETELSLDLLIEEDALSLADDYSALELSKDEILRLERQRRQSATGITEYIISTQQENGARYIARRAGRLYLCSKEVETAPLSIQVLPVTNALDAKTSPDWSMVGYCENGDLWVYPLSEGKHGKQTRITFAQEQGKTAGIAEYIMQEEFDRYTGYWWAPVVASSEKIADSFKVTARILYTEVDESAVKLYNIPKRGIDGDIDEFKYPLVGQENAKVVLNLAELDSTDARNIKVRRKSMKPSLVKKYAWAEYITRCHWTSDGKFVIVQFLDRKQERSTIAGFHLDDFVDESESNTSTENDDEYAGIIISEENSSIWINVSDIFYSFKSSSSTLILSSERSGYRHLYLFYVVHDGNKLKYECKPITQGDWQVDNHQITVDEANNLVFFVGTKDSCLEAHLYCASIPQITSSEKPSSVIRLTDLGYYHDVHVSSDSNYFAVIQSNISTPFRILLYKLEKSSTTEAMAIGTIKLNSSSTDSTNSLAPRRNAPKLFSFISSTTNELIHGAAFLPAQHEQMDGANLPAIIYVYGGPHVQLVTNNFQLCNRFAKLNVYTSLGYAVIIMDNVGSWRRGLQFEGHIKHNMGHKEVYDQIDGIRYLSGRGVIDPNRVLVTGMSYGGYMSLRCLALAPHVFKVAVAGAPVTLWEAYDTAYTERYMGTLDDNAEGYRKSAVTTLASNFPNEPGRLYLYHGLIDENVHWCHTSEFIQKLIEAGKPYGLQVFPNERHGVRSFHSAKAFEHFFLRILIHLRKQ